MDADTVIVKHAMEATMATTTDDDDPILSTALVRSSVVLTPVMDVQTAMARLKDFQDFCAQYLKQSADGGNDGGDFGVIPGTKKATLFKSGADKLAEIYGLCDDYEIVSKIEDFERGMFDYVLRCSLKMRRDDSLVGTGLGSCSTWESKYRWRDAQRVCPACGAPAIIKGKAEYGGGWLCFGRKGGCGAKFADTDPAITTQPVGRVENPDLADLKNTVLKIAMKRAKIAAVIGVTRSSGIFTQDLEDLPPHTMIAETIDVARGTSSTADEPRASSRPILVPSPSPAASERPASGTSDEGVLVKDIAPPRSGQTNGRAWTVYGVTFSDRVRATDGQMVASASTMSESVWKQLENARDSGRRIKPRLVPGKKGFYNLEGFD